jgi:hypothetical protein
MSKLYVITFKETKEMATPDSIKKYWKNYGSARGNGLYGWRPAKKVYYSLGQAKKGFSFIPDELKPQCEISMYAYSESVVDGEDLQVTQDAAQKKREREGRIKSLEWQIKTSLSFISDAGRKKSEVERLTKQLEELKNENTKI